MRPLVNMRFINTPRKVATYTMSAKKGSATQTSRSSSSKSISQPPIAAKSHCHFRFVFSPQSTR